MIPMSYLTMIECAAVFLAILLAAGIGGNDASNAVAAPVGAKLISLPFALGLAAVGELLGALLAGGYVSDRLAHHLIHFGLLGGRSHIIASVLATLLTTSICSLLTARLGWPISITHVLVGGLVGIAAVSPGGLAIVRYKTLSHIFVGWCLTPILAAACSYVLIRLIEKTLRLHPNPHQLASQYGRFGSVGLTTLFAAQLLTKYKARFRAPLLTILLLSVISFLLIDQIVRNIPCFTSRSLPAKSAHASILSGAEMQISFAPACLILSCLIAFAHGANDISNALSPLLILRHYANSFQFCSANTNVMSTFLVLSAFALSLGVLRLGSRVTKTVGTKFTDLDGIGAFCAQIVTAFSVWFASLLGLPVSTTQCLVGALAGILPLSSNAEQAKEGLHAFQRTALLWVGSPLAGFIGASVTFKLLSPLVSRAL